VLNSILKKYFSLIIFLVLIIPLFFGYQIEYVILISGNFWIYFISIIIGFISFLSGYLVIIHFGKDSLDALKMNPVFQNFETKKLGCALLNFALLMIIEELVFRFYLFVILKLEIGEIWGVIVSSIIFSIYHIHIYFQYKDLKLTLIFILFSLILGLYLSFIFIHFGLIGAFLVHFIVVFLIYYFVWKKI